MRDTGSRSAKVIPLHPLKGTKASERKWSKPVIQLGFCIVPSLLLRAQQRLKLDPTQLAVLMHLADYWWDVNRKPHPSKKTLGERLGLSPRQVQRRIAELEAMGLLKRIQRTGAHHGKLSNEYDLSGLVARLKEIAPEVRAVEEKIRSQRRAVARPGLRRRPKAAEES